MALIFQPSTVVVVVSSKVPSLALEVVRSVRVLRVTAGILLVSAYLWNVGSGVARSAPGSVSLVREKPAAPGRFHP